MFWASIGLLGPSSGLSVNCDCLSLMPVEFLLAYVITSFITFMFWKLSVYYILSFSSWIVLFLLECPAKPGLLRLCCMESAVGMPAITAFLFIWWLIK